LGSPTVQGCYTCSPQKENGMIFDAFIGDSYVLSDCRNVVRKTGVVFERYNVRVQRAQADGQLREADAKRYFADVSENNVILDNRELQHFALRIGVF
jgi:hypothetical protein